MEGWSEIFHKIVSFNKYHGKVNRLCISPSVGKNTFNKNQMSCHETALPFQGWLVAVV